MNAEWKFQNLQILIEVSNDLTNYVSSGKWSILGESRKKSKTFFMADNFLFPQNFPTF